MERRTAVNNRKVWETRSIIKKFKYYTRVVAIMPKKSKSEKKKTIFEGDLKKQGISAEQDDEFSEDEQGTTEDKELKIHIGDKEADIYTKEGREELEEEEGEIAPWEEAFAEGATGKGTKGECENCGKTLPQDENKVVEQEYRGETYWFCSQKCAKAGVKKA